MFRAARADAKGLIGTVPNLVTETVVSFIRLSAKCVSKPSTCQNAARSGEIVLSASVM
jgi:hypothetical protein